MGGIPPRLSALVAYPWNCRKIVIEVISNLLRLLVGYLCLTLLLLVFIISSE